MRTFIGVATVVVGVALSTLVAAPPATAADSAVVSGATLVARGAAVDATVTVTCDPYTDYVGSPSTAVDVSVQFRQSVRRGALTTATFDSGFQNLCDGSPHALPVQLLPSPYAAVKGSSLFVVTESFNTFGGAPTPQTFSDVVDVR